MPINSEYGASEEELRAEDEYWRTHPEEARRNDRINGWIAAVGGIALVALLTLIAVL